MITLGIIGLGHVAEYQLEALQEISKIKLQAACDIDRAKASKLPKDIDFYERPETFFQDTNIDAVLVATPNKDHFSIVKQALNSGLHILLEKPATLNLEKFDELSKLAQKQRRFFSIAFHAAFAKDLLWFKENLFGGMRSDLGVMRGFRCGFYDPYIQEGELRSVAKSLGGSWTDSGINALSVMGQLIDGDQLSYVDSTLTRLTQFDCSEVQGTAYFKFEAKDGTFGRGIIDTNWTLGINCKFTELYFDRKTVLLDHSGQLVTLVDPNGSREVLADFSQSGTRLVQHYIGLFQDFIERFSSGNDNIDSARRLHELLFVPYSTFRGPKACL